MAPGRQRKLHAPSAAHGLLVCIMMQSASPLELSGNAVVTIIIKCYHHLYAYICIPD